MKYKILKVVKKKSSSIEELRIFLGRQIGPPPLKASNCVPYHFHKKCFLRSAFKIMHIFFLKSWLYFSD